MTLVFAHALARIKTNLAPTFSHEWILFMIKSLIEEIRVQVVGQIYTLYGYSTKN